MAFKPAVIFPGPLLDGAERFARETSTPTPDPSIISEIGWSSALLAEEDGGYGGTFEDLGAVIEGMAAQAVNLPLATRCGVIPTMLNALPRSSITSALRSQLATGDIRIEWAGPLTRLDPTNMPRATSLDSGGKAVSGTLEHVEMTGECTHIMFAVFDEDTQDILLALVEVDRLDTDGSTYVTVEGRSVRDLMVDDLHLCTRDVLAHAAAADRSLTAGWRIAQAIVSADIVCTMNHALSETVIYLQERKQFGQALAQFQALRHDIAKLYVSFESCKGLLMSSLRLLHDEEQAHTGEINASLELLGLYVRDQAVEFAQSVIQLHGGMGMTRETLAARLATRLIALAFRFGDAYQHTRALQTFQGAQEQ